MKSTIILFILLFIGIGIGHYTGNTQPSEPIVTSDTVVVTRVDTIWRDHYYKSTDVLPQLIIPVVDSTETHKAEYHYDMVSDSLEYHIIVVGSDIEMKKLDITWTLPIITVTDTITINTDRVIYQEDKKKRWYYVGGGMLLGILLTIILL